ncbi:MAG: TRIC cation channel family protein [Sporomusaceae bacterium]|nr:TRIC cation channel family protein [Sporomusaceae bacterium]
MIHIDLAISMNLLGIIAFAFAGAMKAIQEHLDLLGILILGIVYALGGGVVRDILINRIPYAFSANVDVAVAALGVIMAGVVYRLLKRDISNRSYILIPDALGLAAFTTAGAVTAHQTGISGIGLIFLAAITAVGGGVIGDLLLGKIPAVLKNDCYATCSILGGLCFYLATMWNVDLGITSLVSSSITFLIRLLAIRGQWSLPKLTWQKTS